MEKIVSEKAIKALKRRTEAEVKLLERLSGEELELFNKFIDATVEYEDRLRER